VTTSCNVPGLPSLGGSAALDPQNRSLVDWFAGVEQPETSDPNQTQRFLRDVLEYLTGNKQRSLLDFGGSDVSLAKLINLMPWLADDMVAAGVHPVAVYCLSSRVDDLTPLQTMEELGFGPRGNHSGAERRAGGFIPDP
jgi:hypothetical protein